MRISFARALAVTGLLALPAAAWSQTIAFDAIPNQILGISPFPIAAQATSGLPVVFTSTTPTVCKLASDLVMLLSAGTCSVTANSSGAPSATRSFTVSVAKPSGSFREAAGSPFAVKGQPASVAAGDFNGDGKPDLAIANSEDDSVTVLLGNGSGGFAAAPGSPFAVGSYPSSVVVGDFNGDGIQDLATADADDVTVLLGNGSGGFVAAAGGPFAVGTTPLSVAVGDFNGDGIQDLATANSTYNSGNVAVLLGNGSGGFTAASGSPFAGGMDLSSIVVGDFNGDGIQDLATASYGDNEITVLLGNGSGGFTAASGSPFATGLSPNFVVVGDFNGDGIQDLATANYVGNDVTVLLGNGAGGFTAASGSPFTVGTNPASVVAGDFNGDGIQDLATANLDVNNITVLLGNGLGGFTEATGSPYAVGAIPESLAVGDFNGDGIEDVATINLGDNNATVLLGLLVGRTPQTITFGTLSNVTYGVSPFTLGAFASSALAVNLISTNSYVCTVAGRTVTVVGGGICSIVASQPGNATYAAAATVSQSFTVNPAPQTITFAPLSNRTFGSQPTPLSVSATSGLQVDLFSYTPAVCELDGLNVEVLSVGTCSITASQDGDSDYAPAISVTRTFTITASPLQLRTVVPCRIMDTREADGPLGGPFIAANTTRTIPISSSTCDIPANAVAYALNITVVPRGPLGFLTVWPTGESQQYLSSLTSPEGSVLANAAIIPAGTSAEINAYATNDTDLIIDINGYFVPPVTGTLQFYPLLPCRVLDTRKANGVFGGPSIAGGTSRSFPIPSSSCGVPTGAAAYSLNATVVPQSELGYLTAWPTGQTRPLVSTLNSPDGDILANAAVVPVGNGGAVSFFASDTTDLIVDVNGYFAPPASGGLNFYVTAPCQLVYTDGAFGPLGGTLTADTVMAYPLAGSCGLPVYPAVQAYSLNLTVLPQKALGYLTTWPTGATQPVVSTLNSLHGQVVANAAIVPAGTQGSINVFVTDTTDLFIDTNGYFGP